MYIWSLPESATNILVLVSLHCIQREETSNAMISKKGGYRADRRRTGLPDRNFGSNSVKREANVYQLIVWK